MERLRIQENSELIRPPIFRRVFRIAGWLLVAAIAAVIVWRLVSRPMPVEAVKIQREDVVEEVFGTGTLESKVVTTVSSKITGKLVELLVDQGDTVSTGQLLARIESKDLQDSVRVAEAGRDQAEATLSKAQLDLDRQRRLRAKDYVAQSDLDAAETASRVAKAQLRAAEETLGITRANLAYAQIVSETSGLILTRNLEIGSTVVPGSPILRIAADTRSPWIQAWVDERATGKLRLGQPANVFFATDPTHPVPGHVARLSVEVDRVTEEREVDVALARLPDNRFIGQRADVYIETARKDHTLRIPIAGLTRRNGKPGIFLIADGRARWNPVLPGLRGREFVEISGRIQEGALAVANPAAMKNPITDGVRVTVLPDAERP